MIYSSRTGSAICIIIEIPFRKEESFEKKASNVTRTRWDGIYNSRNIAVPFFEAKLRARRGAPIFALHVSYYLTVIDISSPRSCYWKFACATHLDRRTTTQTFRSAFFVRTHETVCSFSVAQYANSMRREETSCFSLFLLLLRKLYSHFVIVYVSCI